MTQYDELTGLLRELLTNKFSPKPRYINGLLGDGLGNVVVPDRPDKVYARFSKESTTYFEIFNVTVPKVNNWPVKIGELPWNPGLTQVVGTNWSAFEQAGWGDVLGSTSPHAPTHEWPDGAPGSDVVSVFTRAIVPGRAFVTPGAPTTIYVNSFEYGTTGTLWPGLPGVDLQPVMSATVTGTMRYAGVYVNEDTNSLGVVTGGTTVYTSALEPPRVSFPATGVIPIARVRVYGGQAGPVEADIKDARRLWGTGGGDGGAGAWPADGKAMINATEYATITLALAAASSGNTVKVGPGTFAENITIPAGVIVVGTSVYGTIISGSVTFGGANGSIERCRITRSGDCITSTQAGVNTVVGCQILPTATFATGVKADGAGVTVVVMYTFIGGGGVSINSLYALNSGTVRAFHCRLDSDLRGLTSGVVYVTNCELTNGSITGDVRGILDLSTGSMTLPYDGFITMDEMAAAPSNPATNSWSLYFKSDGLYHKDDAGAEVGPLGTGGGGAPDDAQYVTLATDATLTNERVLTAGSGISITDAGAGNAVTLSRGDTVKNTSGASVAVGDVGYINHAGEFKQSDAVGMAVNWCVATTAGANGADIKVVNRGRAMVNYSGSAPSAGNFLITSATVGLAAGTAIMQPAIFAVCLAAGSGGQVLAQLLTGTTPIVKAPGFDISRIVTVGDSDFVATIASLPGGAVLTYNAPSAGDENILVTGSTGNLAKIVLHNTTRGTYGLVLSCNAGTNTITLTANVPAGWATGDTITIRSQTNTSTPFAATTFYVDFEFVEINSLARYASFYVILLDTGTAGQRIAFHPFETNDGTKARTIRTQVSNITNDVTAPPIPLISKRFCMVWDASGSNTMTITLRLVEENIASP